MEDNYSNYDDDDVGGEDIVDEEASVIEDALPPEDAEADDDKIDEDDEEDQGAIEAIKGLQRFELVSVEETYQKYLTVKRQTKPYITKYERAKILGVRAQMIAGGDKPLIKVPIHMTDAYEIALLEYNNKRMPLMIRRTNPDGTVEDWRLDDLILI